MSVRGFILQPTYRLEAGRPVVHLWGRLEDGRPFLVRDRRQAPRFWIAAADAPRAARLGAAVRPSRRVTVSGAAVARVDAVLPPDVPPLRARLEGAGIPCYEADVRFALRYLIDRGIRGSLAIRGEPEAGPGGVAVFTDPEVSPADWAPRLRLLSLDIETDPSGRRLLSIALFGCGAAEVLLLTPPGAAVPTAAAPFASEAELLRALDRRVRALDPDALTGWNVVGFDLKVLERLAARHGVRLALGRTAERLRLRPSRSPRRSEEAVIAGRLVLDGIDLLRGAFVRLENYSLEAVARQVLASGKTVLASAGMPDRAAAILEAFQHDRPRFVEYNLTDARLVIEILERLQLVELAVERSRLTGMPPDRVAASIAAFDFLYLAALHRRGVVAPSVASRPSPGAASAGGLVIRPQPGLYRNVVALDFKSLYPSLIRTFEIDPLGLLEDGDEDAAAIVAPNGARFRRRRGILSELLDELAPRREEAKRRGDSVASGAIKILMNSFYGVLGTSACRFHDPRLASAITGFGRALLSWARERTEGWGYPVLYGDTDSLFVDSGLADALAARRLGEELAARLNADLAAHIRATWRVESRLELELERLYLRLFLPPVRHGSGGASKRYAGLVEEGGVRRAVFVGLEVVRRDWTELARAVQRELYERLFDERPVEELLRRVVSDLRSGRLDDQLVYRKALRKDAASYIASTPPHVAAARRMNRRRGRIAYVITQAGPEPAGAPTAPLDYEHYVDRQLWPVAAPVLDLLGLDFRRVIGDEHQLALFEDG